MYPVTQDFLSKIYTNERLLSGRVTFDLTPYDFDTDNPTVTTSTEFAISAASTQLTNNVRQASYNFATWENNRVTLDGNFTFAPTTIADAKEIGFVSSALSDSTSTFTSQTLLTFMPPSVLQSPNYPTITINFTNTHDTNGASITFDTINDEYAIDFKIQFYDVANVLITEEDVTGNTLAQYVMYKTIKNLKKIVVTVEKWSKPYRRARIIEIDPAVVLQFDGNELVRFNLTEELDSITSTLVIPEFEFTVINTDKKFDILNPSGIYSLLQTRQRIYPELALDLGTREEYLPLGLYYLSEWRSDAGTLTTTFRGRSKIDLLDLKNYSQSITSTTNLSAVATAILNTAGVTGYTIDSSLASISTNGLINNMTCREALQMVCIAGCATVRITRDNTLKIETTRATTQTDYIDFDAMLEESQIQQFKQVQTVNVSYYSTLLTLLGTYTTTDSSVTNGEVITVSGNTLINTEARAIAVANWMKSRRNERNLFTVDYRGNPALELNDLVNIENVYENRSIYLTKIEMQYEGYLRSRIEGRTS